MRKVLLGKNVLEAARERIAWTFDTFPRIYLSFSGGKDSTAMMHLVMAEAKKRNRKIGVMFIDWEAQFNLTIEHTQTMFDMYAEWIEPYWISLPLLTTNACSQFEPEWISWEQGREEDWVRQPPPIAITGYNTLPFYNYAMTFEEFIVEFARWYAGDQLCAAFVGIRTVESLNRWRVIAGHATRLEEDKPFTARSIDAAYNVYPIYDWRTEDVWTYQYHSGLPQNKLYDRMHQAGLSIHRMRICEPYGDEQRRGLWLYHIIEPETWGRVVARVSGANNGALYSRETGNVMGNAKITKPDGHTWKSFAMMLLDSMPEKTSDHYKDKIAVWLAWYKQHQGLEDAHDELEGDTGSKDMPSWRRVCKMLLKNDYWCKTLCFSPNKANSYQNYKALMKRRRAKWGIFDDFTD